MRSLSFVVVLSAIAVGCTKPQPTPPEVDSEFRALLETVDEQLPGASAARLTDFRTRHREFDIVAAVDRELDRIHTLADGRYGDAREFAREGDYDRAEAILVDLATNLSETSDGQKAEEHLEFDFYFGKAQALMVTQRWPEAAEVARPLLEEDLTREQEEQVEAILDAAGYVGAAYAQATRGQARAATRQLVIFLEMMLAEEGQYPSQLSLSQVAEWGPIGSRSTLRHLSSIEEYRRTDIGYSFTAVSAQNQHRIRVVDGVIEE